MKSYLLVVCSTRTLTKPANKDAQLKVGAVLLVPFLLVDTIRQRLQGSYSSVSCLISPRLKDGVAGFSLTVKFDRRQVSTRGKRGVANGPASGTGGKEDAAAAAADM